MNEKILADRYRLTSEIGKGGMAIVYKAVDLRTGHNVAVKVLRPEYNEDAEFVSRFQREAEAASKMTHHNIVNLLDVGMDGENRYLVMEYVEGKTLKEVIRERGKLSAPLACQITIRILSALEHAHRNGIVHRDIKPQNILVHADGHIKVADFGIARIADSATLTRGDMVMGSVHYFSPEQARGEGASAASDIYSTGIVLYEMLTGRVPFDGENAVAVAMQHLHNQPIPIQQLAPDVPPAVVAICMKAMEKNPAMRYQSARDMATDIRAALDDRADRSINLDGDEEIQQPKPHLRDADKGAKKTRRMSRLADMGINRKKLRVFWTVVTVLVAIGVGVGLYFGINALINRFSTTVIVPDVLWQYEAEAVGKIKASGADVQIKESSSEEFEAGVVMMQVPEAGETISKANGVVQLLVSTGPKRTQMPDFGDNTSYNDAVKVLNALGVTLITVERAVSGERAIDTVISTIPEAGTLVDRNTQVTLTISGGETTVPNVTGMTLAKAEELITNGKLVLNTALNYVDTEDKALHGTVAQQLPEADSRAVLNAPVTLYLYRCAEVSRTMKIEVNVPESESDVTVRVTIQAEGSIYEIPFVSYVVAADQYRVQEVTLVFPDNRKYVCMVYMDGAVNQRIETEDTP